MATPKEIQMDRPVDISNAALVTHKGCMDGCGCAIMFMRCGGLRENIKFIPAGTVEKFIDHGLEMFDGKFVIFADVGLNVHGSEKYVGILQKRGDVAMLDHHSTSTHLRSIDWCDVRQEHCGTELLRQYLGLNDVNSKRLASLIDDHDRWLLKEPNSQEMASFQNFVGQEEFINRFLHRDLTQDVFTPIELEIMELMVRRRDELMDDVLSRVIVREFRCADQKLTLGYVVSSEPNCSLLLDKMLRQRSDINVAVQINLEKGSVSLRSKDGTDVATIAAYFGGGGHKAAAGHRIPSLLWKLIIDEIHGEDPSNLEL